MAKTKEQVSQQVYGQFSVETLTITDALKYREDQIIGLMMKVDKLEEQLEERRRINRVNEDLLEKYQKNLCPRCLELAERLDQINKISGG